MNNDVSNEEVLQKLKILGIAGAALVGAFFILYSIPVGVLILLWRKKKKEWIFNYLVLIEIIAALLFIDAFNHYVRDLWISAITNYFGQSPKTMATLCSFFVTATNYEFKFIVPIYVILGFCSALIYLFIEEEKEEDSINFEKKERKIKKPHIKKDHKKNIEKFEGNNLYLGRDKYKNKPFILTGKDRIGHQLTVGATRSGKTSRVLIPTIISDFIKGNGVVFADPKGDINNLLSIYKIVKMYGKEDKFKVFCIDDPQISWPYNPLQNGNITQATGRLMKALEWTETFYKLQSEARLSRYLLAMKSKGVIPTLEKVYKIFNAENEENTAGMIANLSRMVNSDFSSLLKYDESGIDFLKAQQTGEFIYILANTNSYLEASKSLIKFIILDLMWCSSKVQSDQILSPKFFSICIDEFGDFHVDGFESFVKQCASAGYSLHLACQSFGDLRSKELEDFIISNTYNHLILRQSYPLNADLAAKIFGTRKTQKATERHSNDAATGDKSVREVDSLRVDPNYIKKLDTGNGIFCNRSILRLLELPMAANFRLPGEPEFMTFDERSRLYEDIFKRAERARKNLHYHENFDVDGYAERYGGDKKSLPQNGVKAQTNDLKEVPPCQPQ